MQTNFQSLSCARSLFSLAFWSVSCSFLPHFRVRQARWLFARCVILASKLPNMRFYSQLLGPSTPQLYPNIFDMHSNRNNRYFTSVILCWFARFSNPSDILILVSVRVGSDHRSFSRNIYWNEHCTYFLIQRFHL